MKKILTLTLALILAISLCACGKEPAASATVANPVHEGTPEEILEATGIRLDAPEGATGAVYAWIEGDAPISQVIFQLDGKEYCYRAQPTAVLSITASIGEDEATASDLLKTLNDGTNVGAVLAGMYYDEWKSAALVDLASSREGVVAFNDGKEGFIAWLDVVPGVLYSLSMDKGATQDLLMNTADTCFVPLQGNAG